MRVYLAGPMAGCTDEEMNGWRTAAKRLRPDITWVDPTVRDYRNVAMTNDDVFDCTNGDKEDILRCHAVLRQAERPSEGSAQETMFAYLQGIRVVAFTSQKFPSPWLLRHAEVYRTLEEAVAAL